MKRVIAVAQSTNDPYQFTMGIFRRSSKTKLTITCDLAFETVSKLSPSVNMLPCMNSGNCFKFLDYGDQSLAGRPRLVVGHYQATDSICFVKLIVSFTIPMSLNDCQYVRNRDGAHSWICPPY